MKPAVIGIMITPLQTKRKTTPTTLVGEMKPIKRPLRPPTYSGPFLEFIIYVALPENFKFPMTLKSSDGTRDPQVHVTMFKSMMLVNGVSDPFLC